MPLTDDQKAQEQLSMEAWMIREFGIPSIEDANKLGMMSSHFAELFQETLELNFPGHDLSEHFRYLYCLCSLMKEACERMNPELLEELKRKQTLGL